MSVNTIGLPQTNPLEAWDGRGPVIWAGVVGAFALGGAALAADRYLTKKLWPENGTFVSDEESQTLVFGGLGEMGGHRVRGILAQFVEGPMCAIQYCNNGVSKVAVARALAEYYQRPTWEAPGSKQTIVAHSMGLPLGLGAMAEIAKNHPAVKVPEISEIHAISSPTCVADTHMEAKLRHIGALPKAGAGVFTKMLLELGWYISTQPANEGASGRSSISKRANKLWHTLSEVAKGATSPLAPRTWKSMGDELVRTRPFREDTFQGIITPDTTVYYYHDPEGDRVVKTPQALRNLAGLAAMYGAKLVSRETLGAGHANTELVAQIVAHHMQHGNVLRGIPTDPAS